MILSHEFPYVFDQFGCARLCGLQQCQLALGHDQAPVGCYGRKHLLLRRMCQCVLGGLLAVSSRADRTGSSRPARTAQQRLHHGTVNFLVRDQHGDIACGVSTSGWRWKYPGRLGDSPIIGAGNYADNRNGAAACTEYGVVMLVVSSSGVCVISTPTVMAGQSKLWFTAAWQ